MNNIECRHCNKAIQALPSIRSTVNQPRVALSEEIEDGIYTIDWFHDEPVGSYRCADGKGFAAPVPECPHCGSRDYVTTQEDLTDVTRCNNCGFHTAKTKPAT